jgi:NAD(P)-dependent dehydrogenase (short-subunit alcohol dehydrogenase family)
MSIDHPVVLITGGSRGIGRACAVAVAEAGIGVVINYVGNAAAANEVVAAINTSGGRAIAVKGDVASEADVLAIYATVDGFGTLVGLVNNAGVVDQTARLDEMSAERLERMMRINVVGAMLVAREAVRRMSTRHGGEGGSIVNISSIAAKLGSPSLFLDYAASKGAIDTFTTGLAREVAGEGVRVNAIRPGLIATDIHASGGDPDRLKRLGSTVPIGREGQPEEIARAALWLLSDDASYVTGAILDVTGGRGVSA